MLGDQLTSILCYFCTSCAIYYCRKECKLCKYVVNACVGLNNTRTYFINDCHVAEFLHANTNKTYRKKSACTGGKQIMQTHKKIFLIIWNFGINNKV